MLRFAKKAPYLLALPSLVLWLVFPGQAVAQRRVAQPTFDLRMVPIARGITESSFGLDDPRFRQTTLCKAAGQCNIDLASPSHPLVLQAYEDGRLFHLFYNELVVTRPDRKYVVQRIKKTLLFYSKAQDHAPARSMTTYLVEAFKLRDGVLKRPDEHVGSFGLGDYYRREVVKDFEIGFADVEGIATGAAWPFDQNILFKALQPYSENRGVYDRVRYTVSKKWTLFAAFDRDENYLFRVPELDIEVFRRLPNPESAGN